MVIVNVTWSTVPPVTEATRVVGRVTVPPVGEAIDTDIKDEYSGVHSSGWAKATQAKTRLLLDLINSNRVNHPIIMVDSDVCVLRDLSNVIDKKYDIQITQMHSGGHRRKIDKIYIKEIACFICFNNLNKSNIFIDRWVNQIKLLGENKNPLPQNSLRQGEYGF